jgi:hypothetical protein
VTGITEVTPDHFYILASNSSLATTDLALHSSSLWSIDQSYYDPLLNAGAQVEEITALP